MTTAETYVTAAFLVLLAAVLLYVIIYAFKMRRLEREVDEIGSLVASEADARPPRPQPGTKTAEPVAGDTEREPEPVR
ncbi:MAG: hypothetical protein ACE5EV_05730 [Gaiellales bacterium]